MYNPERGGEAQFNNQEGRPVEWSATKFIKNRAQMLEMGINPDARERLGKYDINGDVILDAESFITKNLSEISIENQKKLSPLMQMIVEKTKKMEGRG